MTELDDALSQSPRPDENGTAARRCIDYSAMDDVLDDDDDEDTDTEEDEDEESDKPSEHLLPRLDSGTKMVRGTGKVFPSKFVPSNSNTAPLEEFPNRHRHINLVRRTHSNDNTKILLMTDGACLNNGQSNPRAGWAFFQGETINGEPLVVSGRLENRGPWGDEGSQTNNRAELRAVLAALRFRWWRGEGFKTVIFGTDSSYVVDGATQWVRGWVNKSWRTKGARGSGSADVKNKDLWEMLLGECERVHDAGLAIQFWHIPREWNTLADAGAKKAAAEEDAPDRWQHIMGIAL
ncbi:putative ribonuclease H1 [Diaporthe sp. PMI_573]|nr:putative ribonuclease H1 [Diaporthaceae sp. PMI_573]KAH8757957.1 putative ribonuclease H1 [Diaporthaceae sp. PMI_573]